MVVGGLGFAIHTLLPQVAGLEQGLAAFQSGRWGYLGLALVGSSATYVAGAWMVRASVARSMPWRPTILVQLAATAAGVLTPMGAGWATVNQRYLQKRGVDDATATASTGLNMLLTIVCHVGLVVLLIPFLPVLTLPTVDPPQQRILLDGVVVVAVTLGVGWQLPRVRARTISIMGPILGAASEIFGNSRRASSMAAAAVASNLAYGLALYGAVAAFGPAAPPLGVAVAYLLAATVASIAPTPGGLGAMEAALISALTRLGVPGGQAVAATLSFRIATFWLPLGAGALVLSRLRRTGTV